jgi:hypothetical protein
MHSVACIPSYGRPTSRTSGRHGDSRPPCPFIKEDLSSIKLGCTNSIRRQVPLPTTMILMQHPSRRLFIDRPTLLQPLPPDGTKTPIIQLEYSSYICNRPPRRKNCDFWQERLLHQIILNEKNPKMARRLYPPTGRKPSSTPVTPTLPKVPTVETNEKLNQSLQKLTQGQPMFKVAAASTEKHPPAVTVANSAVISPTTSTQARTAAATENEMAESITDLDSANPPSIKDVFQRTEKIFDSAYCPKFGSLAIEMLQSMPGLAPLRLVLTRVQWLLPSLPLPLPSTKSEKLSPNSVPMQHRGSRTGYQDQRRRIRCRCQGPQRE